MNVWHGSKRSKKKSKAPYSHHRRCYSAKETRKRFSYAPTTFSSVFIFVAWATGQPLIILLLLCQPFKSGTGEPINPPFIIVSLWAMFLYFCCRKCYALTVVFRLFVLLLQRRILCYTDTLKSFSAQKRHKENEPSEWDRILKWKGLLSNFTGGFLQLCVHEVRLRLRNLW